MLNSLLFLFVQFSLYSGGIDQKFDVRDYGAIGDGSKLNTSFIQLAIDDCHKKGGGLVQIADGVYVTGTIVLKDGVKLEIQHDAVLKGSDNPLDYRSIDTFVDATGQERGNCLIGAVDAKDIGVIGNGSIHGNGKAFLKENLEKKRRELKLDAEQRKGFGNNRPFLMRFVRSEQIKLMDIRLQDAAAWACHLYQSSHIQIEGIEIYSHANQNNDGIDLDSSQHVTIKNCTIDTGDDAICVKATSAISSSDIQVEDCNLKSDWGAIKFGTESMGDFYNISIKNCHISDTKGGGIKILSVDGSNISNIRIEDIVMKNVDMPIFIRLGERLRTYRGAEKRAVGSIKEVLIRNVKATTRLNSESRVSAPSGIFITGTGNHRIESVQLDQIEIRLEGAGNSVKVKSVEEMTTSYPEFSFFDVLPAYGIYGRHIDSIKLGSIDFNLEKVDSREERVFEDVEQIIKL